MCTVLYAHVQFTDYRNVAVLLPRFKNISKDHVTRTEEPSAAEEKKKKTVYHTYIW